MSALLWQIVAYVCLKLFKGDIYILVRAYLCLLFIFVLSFL